MSQPAPRPATYDDLLSLPEEVRAEVLAGAIVTAPAPLPKHSKAQRALGSFIGGPFDDDDGHGGGVRYDWLVDVDARALEAFELSSQGWLLTGSYGEDAVVRIAPFEQIELSVGRIFLPKT